MFIKKYKEPFAKGEIPSGNWKNVTDPKEKNNLLDFVNTSLEKAMRPADTASLPTAEIAGNISTAADLIALGLLATGAGTPAAFAFKAAAIVASIVEAVTQYKAGKQKDAVVALLGIIPIGKLPFAKKFAGKILGSLATNTVAAEALEFAIKESFGKLNKTEPTDAKSKLEDTFPDEETPEVEDPEVTDDTDTDTDTSEPEETKVDPTKPLENQPIAQEKIEEFQKASEAFVEEFLSTLTLRRQQQVLVGLLDAITGLDEDELPSLVSADRRKTLPEASSDVDSPPETEEIPIDDKKLRKIKVDLRYIKRSLKLLEQRLIAYLGGQSTKRSGESVKQELIGDIKTFQNRLAATYKDVSSLSLMKEEMSLDDKIAVVEKAYDLTVPELQEMSTLFTLPEKIDDIHAKASKIRDILSKVDAFFPETAGFTLVQNQPPRKAHR